MLASAPTCIVTPRRQLLSRPTQLALVKGESYGTCSRRMSPEPDLPVAPPPDLISGPEEMADLVGRIVAEKLAAQAAAEARAAEEAEKLESERKLAVERAVEAALAAPVPEGGEPEADGIEKTGSAS